MSLELLARQRHLYGSVYLTIFPDGILVPWRVLTLQEFMEYQAEVARGHFPLAVFEDEIFKKCVQDPYFIRQQEFLKAGVITTVVEAIWDYSFPKTPSQVTHDLSQAWASYRGDNRLIHDFVVTILLAFPYKPEEVYSMEYEKLLQVLVLADSKLMELGIRKEPTRIVVDGQEETQPAPRQKVDAKKLWEEQHADPYLPKDPPGDIKPTPSGKKGKWYKKSPILEVKPTHGVKVDDGLAGDNLKDFYALGGWERQDLPLERAMMIEDARTIYKDVLEGLEKNKKK